VLAMAREEAIRMRHDYVGTEHILLGLVRERNGPAAKMLDAAGIDPETVRQRVNEVVRTGYSTVQTGELPYTSRSKKTLEYAMDSARELDQGYVGTEHLLLGLVRGEKSIAAQVLNSFGLSLERALELALEVLGKGPGRARSALEIKVDDASDQSIYEQIIAQVQEAVATGSVRPGDRLPAVRQLADELNIAPGTVARAYSELERLGVIVTEGARGTRIAERPRGLAGEADRFETLTGLLRPVAVAAFHLGGTAVELRAALERAMQGIFDPEGG